MNNNSLIVPVLVCTTLMLVVIIAVQADTINTLQYHVNKEAEIVIVQQRPMAQQVYLPRKPMGFKSHQSEPLS